VGTICGYLQRAKGAGLTWALVQGMTDSEVESLLFRDSGRNQAARRAAIDYAHVHHELHKSTATLELLWSAIYLPLIHSVPVVGDFEQRKDLSAELR